MNTIQLVASSNRHPELVI